jgi:hypothetical protein
MKNLRNLLSLLVTAFFALAVVVSTLSSNASARGTQMHTERVPAKTTADIRTSSHAFVGMWVTADGSIRHELLANGRYDEARGSRRSAYQGRYEISGNRINYWDDTGFTADGTFVSNDELHHGGMIFYRTE